MNHAIAPMRGDTIQVHENGFVRLIDWMGSDKDIVEAARVSYKSKGKSEEDDKKLLRYLLTNKHTSPFEMCKIKFNIRMPIFVQRQYIRHRMQNFNEVSARYTELPDVFFIPKQWRTNEGVKNKQSSQAMEEPQLKSVIPGYPVQVAHGASQVVEGFYKQAYALYKELLEAGIAREQARIVLPVGIYTEFYSCWDLNNLLKFFALRDDPHAQGEHQDFAKAMKEHTAKVFPWTMEIYEESQKK